MGSKMTTQADNIIGELAQKLGVSAEIAQKIMADVNANTQGQGITLPVQEKKANKKANKKAKTNGKIDWDNLSDGNLPHWAGGPIMKKGKHFYGFACSLDRKTHSAKDIHDVRVAQLEQAVPGISKVALIRSVGKNANGSKRGQSKYIGADSVLDSNFQYMTNSPFTGIEFPAGKNGDFDKNMKIGEFDMMEVFRRIALCGYSFSSKNHKWITTSTGSPAIRQRHGRALGVLLAADEDMD